MNIDVGDIDIELDMSVELFVCISEVVEMMKEVDNAAVVFVLPLSEMAGIVGEGEMELSETELLVGLGVGLRVGEIELSKTVLLVGLEVGLRVEEMELSETVLLVDLLLVSLESSNCDK